MRSARASNGSPVTFPLELTGGVARGASSCPGGPRGWFSRMRLANPSDIELDVSRSMARIRTPSRLSVRSL